ncbi:MAG: hypothetical protein CFE24_15105 [Flavobacterium sp. BFFFF2]|nr:MAG: hypothetical protein CFE24_15105 [Flavobacterium sp. BFFFF2]
MNITEVKIRIANIIRKCAAQISPELLDVVSDDELIETFDLLTLKCKEKGVKHDGFTLIEAVVRKLSHDKLYPKIIDDTTKTSVDWIEHQMKFKKNRFGLF